MGNLRVYGLKNRGHLVLVLKPSVQGLRPVFLQAVELLNKQQHIGNIILHAHPALGIIFGLPGIRIRASDAENREIYRIKRRHGNKR